MSIEEAIEKVEAVKQFFDMCKEEIRNVSGIKREVQGPDGAISPQSCYDLSMVVNHLKHLQKIKRINLILNINMGCLNDLYVEHFFSEMRPGSNDMPGVLEFCYKFNNACREIVKRYSENSFRIILHQGPITQNHKST